MYLFVNYVLKQITIIFYEFFIIIIIIYITNYNRFVISKILLNLLYLNINYNIYYLYNVINVPQPFLFDHISSHFDLKK